MRRSLLAALLVTLLLTLPTVAQEAPQRLVRTVDGTLYVITGEVRDLIAPTAISDDAIAAIPEGAPWMTGVMMGPEGASEPAPQPAPPEAPAVPVPGAPAAKSATFDGLTVTLLNVERGWKSGNQFTRPKDGMEFLTIEVRLDNGTSVPKDYNGAQFKVATADGARWDWSSARQPPITFGQIPPGATVRGWMAFQVPIGNPAPQLLWQARFNQTLVIAL